MRLLIFLLSFIQFSPHQCNFNIVHVDKNTIYDFENLYEITNRDTKINWRRVFRPIIIFGKKWTNWIAICAAVGALARLVLLLIYYEEIDTADAVVYILAGVVLLSLTMIILLLLITPAVWLFRLLDQINYMSPRRFSRCK